MSKMQKMLYKNRSVTRVTDLRQIPMTNQPL